jgi:imidazolonepropionase-like amidohydrolase
MVFTLMAISQAAHMDAPAVYAIKDAKIVTASGTTIAKGTVVIRDGLIEAVGANVTPPADARIIDGNGLTVYPGLIDAHTDLALEQPPARGAQQQRPGGGPPQPQQPQQTQAPPERPGMNPDRTAADQLRADEARLDRARQAGITTALTIPRTGIFIGQSALINLAGEKPAQMVVKSPVALHIGFTGVGGGTYPGALMGVISYIRQTLLDAQHYRQEENRYRQTKRGVPRPEPDKALDALQPALARQVPVVFTANEPKEIERVVALAEEFNLSPIISGANQSDGAAGLLRSKQIPVLVSLNFPTQPRDADPDADVPLRTLKLRADAPKTPAALHRAGVKFAFTSGFMAEPRDFIRNAAKAVKAGLPEEAAIKALTINAAEIFGVAEQLGSIEAGKIANLVVTTGSLFEERTRIKHVFIDGREIEVKPEPERPERPERPGAAEERPAPDVSGTWNLVVDSPQGQVDITATLRQAGTKITGSMTSMFGESNVTDGSISGNTIQFTTVVDIQGQMLEVKYEGTIQGNSMSGTVTVQGIGSMPFSGTRPRRGGEL